MTNRPITVCLNMIVKDEAHVIARCLADVRDLIDHWVIVDTGSTDGTQDIIRKTLVGVPGDLHERPWVNFGQNRSEAIALAAGKADYILTIDADETLKRNDDFRWGDLTADSYMLVKERGPRRYRVPSLVRDGLAWRWHGVLHEYLAADDEGQRELLDGIIVSSPREGARAKDPQTYRRDALMLEQALLDDPDNHRNVFYLAQSYRDCEDHDLALRWYRKRVDLGGWEEEVYIAQLNIALILTRTEAPWPEQLAAYLAAHRVLPNRPEALFYLGDCCSEREDWANAWLFMKAAMETKTDPDHVLFLEPEIVLWQAKLEASVAAFYLNDFATALALSEQLLAEGHLPDRLADKVQTNRDLAKSRMD